jgi:anti-sigma regulatory factor (Ser/Thr protein kinase)
LQRSLLPAAVPPTECLHVAAYYVPGVEGTQAGGDWYDVIALPRGRSALVVGDVMGRGVAAAAVMGQLRATVRAYARLDLPPARLLALLDAAVQETTESMIVTCVYAVHDPAAGTLTYGNAGHLPPILTVPGGAAGQVLGVGDPPLGTGHYAGKVETVAWPVGARLTLYTDGLVEHRGSDIDVGVDHLRRALVDTELPVEALPGALVEALLSRALLADAPDDDVAILVAEACDPGAGGMAVPVPLVPEAVAVMRRHARELLAAAGVSDDCRADVLLVVSELVTNAVRYGEAPAQLRVRLTNREVVVEVSDAAVTRPRRPEFDPAAATGRGLHMVESIGARWGVRPTGVGKVVWSIVARS